MMKLQTSGEVDTANLDRFSARYYSSQLGRFMTPDWSDSPTRIPYASLANPQSLNLYTYVLNNPASSTDPDGHDAGQTAGGYGPKPNVFCNELNPCGPFGESQQADEAEAEYADGVLGPASALVAAQDAARHNPAFAYGGPGHSHCNQATCAVAKAMGAPMGPLTDADGNALSANQMAANLAASASNGGPYREVSPAEAQLLADEGKLVIGAWQNPNGPGHVLTVRPQGVAGDLIHPDSRGVLVNDIGTNDRVSGVNWAFQRPALANVRYYTPTGGGGQ